MISPVPKARVSGLRSKSAVPLVAVIGAIAGLRWDLKPAKGMTRELLALAQLHLLTTVASHADTEKPVTTKHVQHASETVADPEGLIADAGNLHGWSAL
jgi:hypothetical protein